MNGLGEEIQGVLDNAVEILNAANKTEALSHMAITFCLQLLATLVLFLIIRFKFWNLITNMIESRKKSVEDSIKAKDEALQELEEAKKEAELVKIDSKRKAIMIIEEAKKTSQIEADAIIHDANEKIKRDTENARELIEKEHQEMQEEMRNEVIEVAYSIAEKMVNHEMNREANKEIIDKTIGNLNQSK